MGTFRRLRLVNATSDETVRVDYDSMGSFGAPSGSLNVPPGAAIVFPYSENLHDGNSTPRVNATMKVLSAGGSELGRSASTWDLRHSVYGNLMRITITVQVVGTGSAAEWTASAVVSKNLIDDDPEATTLTQSIPRNPTVRVPKPFKKGTKHKIIALVTVAKDLSGKDLAWANRLLKQIDRRAKKKKKKR